MLSNKRAVRSVWNRYFDAVKKDKKMPFSSVYAGFLGCVKECPARDAMQAEVVTSGKELKKKKHC